MEQELGKYSAPIIDTVPSAQLLNLSLNYRALAMARNFPCVEVVGVDIAPTPIAIEHVPENIRFELDDINQGLEHFKDQFDLVHMRCVGAGLPNYSQAITYAASCVKPGGILLIGEIDTNLCAEDMVSTLKMATLKQPNGSWLQRYRYGKTNPFVLVPYLSSSSPTSCFLGSSLSNRTKTSR